jgi:hypothetical protein
MLEVFGENSLPGGLHGIQRSGQREDQGFAIAAQTGRRPREDRRTTNLLVREHPENLAESRHGFFDQAFNHRNRVVTLGDTRAARGDDRLNVTSSQPRFERATNRIRIVLNDASRQHLMPAILEHGFQVLARRVRLWRARVRDGQDGGSNGFRGALTVLGAASGHG